MEERKFHINVLDLKAAKLAIISFTLKERDAISVQIRMDKNQKQGVDCDQQRNLAILFEVKDNDYCRILTRINEYRCRKGIHETRDSSE